MKMVLIQTMKTVNFVFSLVVLLLLWGGGFLPSQAHMHRYTFIIKEASYTRLCSTKNILTVNGQFPGPTLHFREGDTNIISIYNKGNENITIHWHGVKQLRYPWSDGPEYITQCPIQPGTSFTQKIVLSDEVGTLWWHAHSDWSRATIHGAIIVYPKLGVNYPFPLPYKQITIVLGEWWKSDIQDVLDEFLANGGAPNVSDAFLINGQPGDLYPCSKSGTFKLAVKYGKTYMLRLVNTVMNNILFFGIAHHQLKVVGIDGAYTKPLHTFYVAISPGQTIDLLLNADQKPDQYYMAAKTYNSAKTVEFDNTTTTGILEYLGEYDSTSSPHLPHLPVYNDTYASTSFFSSLRSLPTRANVPTKIETQFYFTLSINLRPCEKNKMCKGTRGQRFAASINNISFVNPSLDILQAYYNQHFLGVFNNDFPSFPPTTFNFTGIDPLASLVLPYLATKVRVLEYNTSVEIVFQGTNLVAGLDHPMHLHGHNFYVVGWGLGNFNPEKDPLGYNLVDPPLMTTITVPKNGWTTIRFRANNPGVWLMHCHIERHITWGMKTVFLIKNGRSLQERLLPPPAYMPPC